MTLLIFFFSINIDTREECCIEYVLYGVLFCAAWSITICVSLVTWMLLWDAFDTLSHHEKRDSASHITRDFTPKTTKLIHLSEKGIISDRRYRLLCNLLRVILLANKEAILAVILSSMLCSIYPHSRLNQAGMNKKRQTKHRVNTFHDKKILCSCQSPVIYSRTKTVKTAHKTQNRI